MEVSARTATFRRVGNRYFRDRSRLPASIGSVGLGAQNVRVVGRYALYQAIAAGGMATVHLGRLLGPVGFSRTVAIKRLHAQFASDPEFVSMFLDEARLAARIRHPNVVPTLDVVATAGELFLVMEYVPGESVARLSRALRERKQTIPLRILCTIMAGVLHGLHAAHEAKDERGHPLGIVHRDMSPQNVLVGTDGVPKVLDFGVAKAAGRMQTTKEGQIKGKLSYMPPEQLRGSTVSRQTDIYAAGVMLWELVTGQRLFAGDNEGVIVARILEGKIQTPSHVLAVGKRTLTDQAMRQLESLDRTILRSLSMKPEDRFPTAREMAIAIERTCPPVTATEIGEWVEITARDVLDSRAQMIADIESSAGTSLQSREQDVMTVLQGQATLPPGSVAAHGDQTMPMPKTMRVSVPSYYAQEGPPVTQPSSISVSHASMAPHDEDKPYRKAGIAAVIGLFLGASFLATVLVVRHGRQNAQAAAQQSGADTTSLMSTAAPTTSATPLIVNEPATIPPVPEAADAGAAVATPTAKPAKPRPAPGTAKSAEKPPEKPPVSEPDCSTPYWYDAQGVKHYKQQCLGK